MLLTLFIYCFSASLIAGTHVRFRLGGHTFPPNVYFKIYTHRPLCDVNSFAPRDYNKEKKQRIGIQMGMTRTAETTKSGGSDEKISASLNCNQSFTYLLCSEVNDAELTRIAKFGRERSHASDGCPSRD